MILLVFASCDDKKTNKPTTQQVPAKKEIKIPDFNADSAYHYVKKQVDFGPRVPGSEAHSQCADWFVDFFNEKADTVFIQNFRTRLYNGRGIDGKNIIAPACLPRSQRAWCRPHSRPPARDRGDSPPAHRAPPRRMKRRSKRGAPSGPPRPPIFCSYPVLLSRKGGE